MANDGRDSIGVTADGRKRRKSASESEPDPDADSDVDEDKYEKSHRSRSKRKKGGSSRRRSRDSESYSSSSSEYDSESLDSYSSPEDSEDQRRRRRKEKKRREEKKEKRRKEKERHRKKKDREEKRKKDKKEKKKRKDEKKGAVTGSWGKYGIIRETDMWNKRPEFTAWLLEVKHVNLESLPNWEEKQLFKDFMEDHNTATFPSKKYYNLDAYYQRKMEKAMKKGHGKIVEAERTVFDDEEQRRLELRLERERQKEEQVEALKRSMQDGMAQAMKEQAQLREEMAYLFKIGKMDAAAAIQRRLDPDVAM